MMYAIKYRQNDDSVMILCKSRIYDKDKVLSKVREQLPKNIVILSIDEIDRSTIRIDQLPSNKNELVKILRLFIEEACELVYLNVDSYYSERRHKRLCELRAIVYKLFREYTTLSLADIGKMHNRHHSTIIHSLKSFDDWMMTDGNFIKKYEKVSDLFDQFLDEYQI